MAIQAKMAHNLSEAGLREKEEKADRARFIEKLAFEERAQQFAGYAREKLDEAVMVAVAEGFYTCMIWFPEKADLMRRVRSIIHDEYKALGYIMGGGVIEDSRHHKYEIILDWGKH